MVFQLWHVVVIGFVLFYLGAAVGVMIARLEYRDQAGRLAADRAQKEKAASELVLKLSKVAEIAQRHPAIIDMYKPDNGASSVEGPA